jgi:archaellin
MVMICWTMVTINLEKANYNETMTTDLTGGTTFSLTITPPDGSILPIERSMPTRVRGLVNLY